MLKVLEDINLNHHAMVASPKQQAKIMANLETMSEISLAANPKLSKKNQQILYQKLKQENNFFVLKILAENPNLILPIQLELAHHPDKYIKEFLSRNQNLNSKVQIILANDLEYNVLFNLSKNICLVGEAQKILYATSRKEDYGKVSIKVNLARNSNLIPELFNDLYLEYQHIQFFQELSKSYHNPLTQEKLKKAFLLK